MTRYIQLNVVLPLEFIFLVFSVVHFQCGLNYVGYVGDYVSDGMLASENVVSYLPLNMVDWFALEEFSTIFLINDSPQYNWG